MPRDEIVQAIVRDFLVEAQEACAKVTGDLLALEKPKLSPEILGQTYDSLARQLHTLKGSAATLGLETLSDLAHRMENIVAPYRKSKAPLERHAADGLLAGLDAFMAGVRAAADGADDQLVDPAMLERLTVIAKGGAPVPAPPPKEPAPARAEPETDDGSWRVEARQVTELMREIERVRELRLRLEERRRALEQNLTKLARHDATPEQ